MKKLFQNMNLFLKLLAGGLAPILLIALLSFTMVAYFFENSNRANTIHGIVNNITIQILQARLAEKNFVLRDLHKKEFYESGTSKYLEKHAITISSVQREIHKLINLSPAEKKGSVQKLYNLVNDYNALFLRLVAAYRERGFKDWGLMGQWRQAIHHVEQRVSQLHTPNLLKDLLELRRYEKDYLLREEDQYIRDHGLLLKNLQNQVAELEGPEPVAILKGLKIYEAAFKKYIDIQGKIGLTEESGLQWDFLQAVHGVEPVIERTLQEADLANKKARRNFVQASFLIYIFGIGLGSAIFYVFARSIASTLIQLKNAVLDVGKGRLDTKIGIKSKDEIGILAASFNKMTEDLKKTTVSKDYVDKIIQSMADTLIVVSPEATIKTVNQATLNLLGYQEDELIGKPVSVVFDERSFKTSPIDDLLKEGFIHKGEKFYLKKDRHTVPVLFSGSIMRGDDAKIQGIVCVAQDITERKRAEDMLRESERELRLLSSQILATQEKERKRVAQQLHDSIGQSLTGIKYCVENTLNTMQRGSNVSIKKSLEPVVPMIQDAIEEVQKIAVDLRPRMLEELGITATISWFCRQFQKIYSGIRVEKQIEIEEQELPESLKTIIFRILQEAFNNVARHSNANLVRLSLVKKDGSIELVIKDNGSGFDVKDALRIENSGRGFGLASMKERAELSGGSFAIRSRKGNGTMIWALWPFPIV
jgi:PAS domain S-box-containing protein